MSAATHGNPKSPLIGILMLETTFPRIKGDIGNPQTFSFPVVYQTVHGASVQKLVIEADPGLVHDFTAAGRLLVTRGVKAITTSCGFSALFHRQLAEALPVPVFSSSLLQVHLAQALIRRDQKIGIITARQSSLTHAHLAGVGIQHYPTAVIGMEHAPEFSAVFIGGKTTLDEKQCHQEMQAAAEQLLHDHPDVGVIVLECTNMPPFADTVRRATGLPVFDAVTMVNHAYSLLMSE
jgi:Asp/Glu/hydantoin racemase